MTRSEKTRIKREIKNLKPVKLFFERSYSNKCETYDFSFCYNCEDGDAIVNENGVYFGYISDWINYISCLNITTEEVESEILRNAIKEN